MSNHQCLSPETTYYSWELTSNMICASKEGEDYFPVDQGGPLVTLEAGHYTLIGVYSHSERGHGEYPFNLTSPGIYARVTSQLDWINSQITGYICAP